MHANTCQPQDDTANVTQILLRIHVTLAKLRPTIVMFKMWVPANAVNYSLPSDVRILFVNVVALGWTVYLSTVEREAAAAASNARRT